MLHRIFLKAKLKLIFYFMYDFIHTDMDIEYQEVLYNDCYGGFSFSKEFEDEYKKRYGDKELYTHKRTNPNVLNLFKEMGESANSRFANIKITNIILEFFINYIINLYNKSKYIKEIAKSTTKITKFTISTSQIKSCAHVQMLT